MRFHAQDVARLRLGLGVGVEPVVVAPLIREVMDRMPDLELTLRYGEIKALNEWLLASETDVILTAEADRLTERANRWPVFSDPVVILLPAGHALAAPGGVTVGQLGAHPLVGRLEGAEAGAADPGGADTGLEALYRALPVRHRGATDEQVHAIVQVGLGLALSTARRRLPAGVVSRVIEPEQRLDIVVAAMAGRPASRAADAFLRLARARAWDG
jgi:hypothetical protein